MVVGVEAVARPRLQNPMCCSGHRCQLGRQGWLWPTRQNSGLGACETSRSNSQKRPPIDSQFPHTMNHGSLRQHVQNTPGCAVVLRPFQGRDSWSRLRMNLWMRRTVKKCDACCMHSPQCCLICRARPWHHAQAFTVHTWTTRPGTT